MTDTTARADAAAPAPADAAAHPADPAAAAPAPDEIAAALARENEMKDRLLRTLAEMENLRKRTEREIADARSYGVSSFARDLLGVADNMRRALDAVSPEQRADASLKALIEGFELTGKELDKALEKAGIRKFEPQGEKFDPNLHQAMFEMPDPNIPLGFVAQVVQAGYMIGERMLRPALVGVSKGAPKTEAPPAS